MSNTLQLFSNYRYGHTYAALYNGDLSHAFVNGSELIPYYIYFYFARDYAKNCLKKSQRAHYEYSEFKTTTSYGYSRTEKTDGGVVAIDPVMKTNALYYLENYIFGLSQYWVRDDVKRLFEKKKCASLDIKKLRLNLIALGQNWEKDKQCKGWCQVKKLRQGGK